jgi:hypothetical protein
VTIRRFEIVPLVGTGETGTGADGDPNGLPEDPIRPDIDGAYQVLGRVGDRVLVKRLVPDGTAQTQGTLADVVAGGLDVNAAALTVTQRNAIKTFLTNRGIDIGQFDSDGVDDRRKLLQFILRRVLGWNVQDFRRAFTDYDAAG